MADCANCGGENPAGHRFCGQCGTSLAIACAACGTEWLLDVGRRAEAEPLLARARAGFAELEAPPWLDRIDALLPALVSA